MRAWIALVVFLSFALPAGAQVKDWEKEWNRILLAAKKEGKVTIAANPDPDVRRMIPERFTARYGIPVEYIAGTSGQIRTRLQAERAAGLYTIDALLGGVDPVIYDDKMLDPLKPALVLPEVLDLSKWEKGKLWFSDPEQQYVLRILLNVVAVFDINTRHVRPEDVKSVKYFLDPKWKGKISTHDPTIAGTGNSRAAYFYVLFGADFLKRLYVDQEVVVSRDRRQMADWLVRGTHPVALGAQSQELERLAKEGFPVAQLNNIPDAPGYLSSGPGEIALVNKAPHPNAAKVFVNWMASREGVETLARSQLDNPLRTDIDKSFVQAETIPRPNVVYKVDSGDWTYQRETREKVRLLLKEMLKR
ncbi:MAG TPA: extracellular solute-binding protein [Candidatus Acidoferrales bacterium]|nr:extracellular solute-binding protein [Candidatus Acidoferrales bacterium]